MERKEDCVQRSRAGVFGRDIGEKGVDLAKNYGWFQPRRTTTYLEFE